MIHYMLFFSLNPNLNYPYVAKQQFFHDKGHNFTNISNYLKNAQEFIKENINISKEEKIKNKN